MSRNLGSPDCARCRSEVRLEEAPRQMQEADSPEYFKEYANLFVAHATCSSCGARYLAWCRTPLLPETCNKIYDLSYRSTFNDEPGEEDLPFPTVSAKILSVHCPKILSVEVDKDAYETMRNRGGDWVVYRNEAMDSCNCGHLQFLKVGAGCTFTAPPDGYPADNMHGMGWRYKPLGYLQFDH